PHRLTSRPTKPSCVYWPITLDGRATNWNWCAAILHATKSSKFTGSPMNSSTNSQPERAANLRPVARRSFQEWSFSLLLGIVYVAVFNLWRFLQPEGVIVSALAVTVFLCVCFGIACARKYFGGFWEGFLHFVVILDILLEGLLPPSHESRGFYWCALAFAILIVGYLLSLRRRKPIRPLAG